MSRTAYLIAFIFFFIVTACRSNDTSAPATNANATTSVVLNVTTSGEGAGARDPREYWEETFARKAEKNEPERKREGKAKEEREGEECAARPQKIADSVRMLATS